MKTAEELMPGGRWLSMPGSDYESAFYALAIGLSTNTGLRRPLVWSQQTPERATYDSLLKLWMDETTPPYQRLRDDMNFQPVMLRALISVWNHSKRTGHYIELLEKDGRWRSLGSGYVTSWSTAVLVRQVNNRWECFGYFGQELGLARILDLSGASSTSAVRTAPKSWGQLAAAAHRLHVSAKGCKSSLRDGQGSSTFSPIVQVDIKPVAGTQKATGPRNPKSSSTMMSFGDSSIEWMISFLRRYPMEFVRPIERLCRWTEVLDASGNEAIRPFVGRLCSEMGQAGFTALQVLNHLNATGTIQQKADFAARMKEFEKQQKRQQTKKEEMEFPKQKEKANGEHEGNSNGAQKGDKNVEQKKEEAGKQKEEEDAEQRRRKEAEAAAVAYAAQDRYDSCSDSD
ncbi:hypothetical protein KCU95_g8484, partial [Aureobasidium melanogenum]